MPNNINDLPQKFTELIVEFSDYYYDLKKDYAISVLELNKLKKDYKELNNKYEKLCKDITERELRNIY
jgi:archaellum component FlaC